MPPKFAPSLEHEIGGSGTYSPSGYIVELGEDTPELRWPNSVVVYDRMRRSESKCGSVLRAINFPIRGTDWRVEDSPDVRPEVANFVRTNLGLQPKGAGRRRRRDQGISWDSLLRPSLLHLPFGHMFFEPVYQIAGPGPDQAGLPPGPYAHLASMAPRLPRTLTGINIADNGDLAGIRQLVVRSDGRTNEVTIPADRLVPFVNDREGSDWAGMSILRTAYKHFLLKDMLERVGAMMIERNGMGVPVVNYPPEGDRGLALALATGFRAGEQSGGALPVGYSVELVVPKGQVPDALPQIRYHGEQIPHSVLAMFLDLGTTATGARALGETFVDFFTMSLNAVIAYTEETATEKISRTLVALNFGDDEPYPEIVADPLMPQAPVTADAVAQLVTAGVITADDALEADVRRRFGLPRATNPRPDQDPADEPRDPSGDVIDVTSPGGGAMSGEAGHLTGSVQDLRERLAKLRRGAPRRGRRN